MNYEELLESRSGAAMSKENTPFGVLYKKIVDGKYASVIDLKDNLVDSLVFSEALAAENKQNKQLSHKSQLHFEQLADSSGLYGVNLGSGSFHTFERLLSDNPAVIAGPNFMHGTIMELLDITAYLHDLGIQHICYAPNNVFARKGDNAVMLLFHGSAYRVVNDQQELYGDSAEFVAPEVLEEGVFDERADIYSIGKFIEYLYQQSELPLELKGVVKKATAADPDKRYQTVEEMKSSINSRQATRKSAVMGVAALLIVALCFGMYFTLTPEPEDIEFVKPAPKEAEDDFLDDGFDPTTELGLIVDTAAAHLDEKKLREYEAKAEEIFRKNFTTEASRVLSEIYTDDRMHSTEKNFRAGSQSTMEELVQIQARLGKDAGLSETRSQVIASQIIEQVSNRLKAEMDAREKNGE